MFYPLAKRLFYSFCFNINQAHWFLLCQPKFWLSRQVVVIGSGNVGKNIISLLIRLNKTFIIIDDKAARYPYSILNHPVHPWAYLSQNSALHKPSTCFVLTMFEGVDEAKAKLNATDNMLYFEKNWQSFGPITLGKSYLARLKRLSLSNKFDGLSALHEPVVLYVEHNLGGGTYQFSKGQIEQLLVASSPVLVLTYCDDGFHLSNANTKSLIGSYYSLAQLQHSLHKTHIEHLILSNLYGFEKPLAVLNLLLALPCEYITSYIHDYFSVCQSYTLWNDKNQYCQLPQPEVCNQCIKHNHNVQDQTLSIQAWRLVWQKVLLASDKVVTFSQNSLIKIQSIYPQLTNIVVQPHSMDYFQPRHFFAKAPTTQAVFTIGVLGPVTQKKGADVIVKLNDYINNHAPQSQIVIIGRAVKKISALENVHVSGAYDISVLDSLCAEYKIDVFLFCSLCPETFSFATSEIILMKYPIVCFDLGAQADKVLQYPKGAVVPISTEAEEIFLCLKNMAGCEQNK